MSEQRADMVILLRADTLEFACNGKSLGKFKHALAKDIYTRIKKAPECERTQLIQSAYERLSGQSSTQTGDETPAGFSAGYFREIANA